MKKFITGVALLLTPFFTSAEIRFVSEILVGQSQYQMDSSIRREVQTEVSEESYSTSLSSDSFGFRLGAKFTDNFSFELAKHEHGESVGYIAVSFPTALPAEGCCLGPDHDMIRVAIVPIDLESIRLGVKGEIEMFSNTFVNARLGLAHWKYGEFTPHKLTAISAQSNSGESGNDIYYSFGVEYKFTKNIFIGAEYSLFTIDEKKIFHDELSGTYKNIVKDISFVIGWAF